MAKSKAPSSSKSRLAAAGAGAVAARAESHAPKKRTSPLQFFREVRAEARKITWPSWKETWITSVMVLIMVGITTVFFWILDFILSFGVQWILRLPTLLSS